VPEVLGVFQGVLVVVAGPARLVEVLEALAALAQAG
jgi:hypothetical protein